MYYVYVISSKDAECSYIGSTADLKQRLKAHNWGRSAFTSKASDWKLIYYEAFISKNDAVEEEKFLKTGKGRERLKYLLKESIKKADGEFA